MDQQRSLAMVLEDLLDEGRALFRSEVRLARAEMAEKANRMKTGLILAGAGAVLLLASLVMFLEAAIGGLMAAGLSFAVSALIVGAVVLALGAIVAMAGASRLKAKNLAPTKTARQLRRDVSLSNQVHA
jgi:hypothetical protein